MPLTGRQFSKKDYDKVHDKITATVDQVDNLLKAPKSRELITLI